jgi:hypothetical protein
VSCNNIGVTNKRIVYVENRKRRKVVPISGETPSNGVWSRSGAGDDSQKIPYFSYQPRVKVLLMKFDLCLMYL